MIRHTLQVQNVDQSVISKKEEERNSFTIFKSESKVVDCFFSGRNVLWSLRSKLSVAKTRMRRWKNSEILCFLNISFQWRFISSNVFSQVFGGCDLLNFSSWCFPSGVLFASPSERSSSAQMSVMWFQWQKPPLSFWCLRSLCTSKLAFPKRWDGKSSLTTQPPSHWAATSDPSNLWTDPPQTFYHGEPVPVNVEITNSSSRNIKDINISGEQSSFDVCHHAPVLSLPVQHVCLCSVEQVTNVVLYSNDKYVKSVAKEETEWAKLFLNSKSYPL